MKHTAFYNALLLLFSLATITPAYAMKRDTRPPKLKEADRGEVDGVRSPLSEALFQASIYQAENHSAQDEMSSLRTALEQSWATDLRKTIGQAYEGTTSKDTVNDEFTRAQKHLDPTLVSDFEDLRISTLEVLHTRQETDAIGKGLLKVFAVVKEAYAEVKHGERAPKKAAGKSKKD